jgi:hypothetical protein
MTGAFKLTESDNKKNVFVNPQQYNSSSINEQTAVNNYHNDD